MTQPESNPNNTSAAPKKWFPIRGEIGVVSKFLLGALCIVSVFGLWWFVTLGEEAESRLPPKRSIRFMNSGLIDS